MGNRTRLSMRLPSGLRTEELPIGGAKAACHYTHLSFRPSAATEESGPQLSEAC